MPPTLVQHRAKLAVLVVAGALLGLAGLRALDAWADRSEWRRLGALRPAMPVRYSPAMVAGLPGAAQRYFHYMIKPGAPLHTVVEIHMGGRFSLGTLEKPAYRAMEARQILAAPAGFLWRMRTRQGIPIAGSDGISWTRFRIFGLLPVARSGGDTDHARSAFGRQVAEAAFWSPAALLPRDGVTWEGLDADRARVIVQQGGLEQAVDITIDADGRPAEVRFMRWTNANPGKVYRLQPFGGYLSDFRDVDGYRLPFRVEAGNMFGTEAYFPFFIAEVSAIRFR